MAFGVTYSVQYSVIILCILFVSLESRSIALNFVATVLSVCTNLALKMLNF